jgi:anti-anti-sigma regulatory factor
VIDLQDAHVVDHTVLEKLHHMVDEWQRIGKSLTIRGLDGHTKASGHELSVRWKRDPSSAA